MSDEAAMALSRAIENLARAIAELAGRLPYGGKFTVVQSQERPPGGYGDGDTGAGYP